MVNFLLGTVQIILQSFHPEINQVTLFSPLANTHSLKLKTGSSPFCHHFQRVLLFVFVECIDQVTVSPTIMEVENGFN